MVYSYSWLGYAAAAQGYLSGGNRRNSMHNVVVDFSWDSCFGFGLPAYRRISDVGTDVKPEARTRWFRQYRRGHIKNKDFTRTHCYTFLSKLYTSSAGTRHGQPA